jgi:LPXTG-site transpeptidase (sortase) family protein
MPRQKIKAGLGYSKLNNMINFLNKIERKAKRKRASLALGCLFILAVVFHFSPYLIAEAKFYLKNDSYKESIQLSTNTEEKIIEPEPMIVELKNNTEITNNTSAAMVVQKTKENSSQADPKKSLTIASYKTSNKSEQKTYPISDSYTLLIPKINVESKIKLNVDMFDKKAYNQALTQGVAQASGTALPGEHGNSFIFGHSSAPLGITKKSAKIEFVLLNHLKIGDEIFISKGSNKYSYKIFDKKVISADSVEYIDKYYGKDTVTLMTCWPIGTNLKRLIVVAEIEE